MNKSMVGPSNMQDGWHEVPNLEQCTDHRQPLEVWAMKSKQDMVGVVPAIPISKAQQLTPSRTKAAISEQINEGWAARLASNKYFEGMTLAVISFNALWIGVDMELNDASIWTDAKPIFQIMDNFFCVYFTLEVTIRFLAFRDKLFCWRDKSFVFDALLVILMIVETWVLVIIATMGNAGGQGGDGMRQLSILRLLRLLRLTRMARLMRSMPELMTLMKGLIAALRSVATTFLFLIGILWVFGIVFNQQYKEDTGPLELYFSRLGISMVTLFVNGTLLDEVTAVLVALKDDSTIMTLVFFLFLLLSSITLMNMLIGVLSEVVKNTAENETETMNIANAMETLKQVFRVCDSNSDNKVTAAEFEDMIEDKNSPAVQALLSLGIQEDRLRELSRQLFEDEDAEPPTRDAWESQKGAEAGRQPKWTPKDLTFTQFMEELLLLKPGSAVSVRDMTTLRRLSKNVCRSMDSALQQVQKEIRSMTDASLRQVENGMSNAPQLASDNKLSVVPTPLLLDEILRRLDSAPKIASAMTACP